MAISEIISDPIRRGETVLVTLTELPVGTNITGWTLLLSVKAKLSDVSTLFTCAGTVTDGPNGIATFTMTAAQTQPLANGTYNFDIWRTDVGGESALTIGTFAVRGSVHIP